MPLETRCAWCSKPLLDPGHATKHVLEQCEKAPWRARLAELEQTNIRQAKEMERLQRDLDALAATARRWSHERNVAIAGNTPLKGVVTAARLFVEAQTRLKAAEHPCEGGMLDAIADEAYGDLATAVAALGKHPQETETPAWGPSPASDNTAFRQPADHGPCVDCGEDAGPLKDDR